MMTEPSGDMDAIARSGLFDPAWYLRAYGDAALLGGDPLLHFLRHGRLLRRSPGPEFDTRFYLETYRDAAESPGNPLLHHLSCEDRARRPLTPAALRTEMDRLAHATVTHWRAGKPLPARRPVISYCTPVRGRLDDLKGSLRANLDENAPYRDQVEFLIVEFDQDGAVRHWLEAHFAAELADGYLRVVSDPDTLDSWHFGKAKNAFRPHLHGEIYSSLDGDNFVTAAETAQLLDLAKAHPAGFVFHHFSGQWGDGTSGRVSMPASVYREIGYDPRLMPRQFDEMDLILGALARFPALPFIGVHADRSIMTMTHHVQEFMAAECRGNRRLFIGPAARQRAPLNPRGADYADKLVHWRHMNNFNAACSMLRRSFPSERQGAYLAQVAAPKHQLIESLPAAEVLSTLFRLEDLPPFQPDVRPVTVSDICVVACLHDEEHFLPRFVSHHRALGVTHFFLIDDRSARPLRETAPEMGLGENILILRPKVGDFRTAKTLWLEAVLKAFVPEGTWVCSLDADELLQVPETHAGLAAVAHELETAGRDFATCLLLDMLPPPDLPPERLDRAQEDYENLFTTYCDRGSPPAADYAGHRSIVWGFGAQAGLSWRFDARFHAFGTFDSLRKLAMFRYRVNRHLNQGFHSFHFIDGTPEPGPEIWQNDPILPIFHYKLVRLFSEARRAKMLELTGGYHARTGQNIRQIFGQGPRQTLARLATLAPDLRPAAEARRPGTFRREV